MTPAFKYDLITHLVDYGRLKRIAEDTYEDEGGHIWHESNLDEDALAHFWGALQPRDRAEIAQSILTGGAGLLSCSCGHTFDLRKGKYIGSQFGKLALYNCPECQSTCSVKIDILRNKRHA